MTTDELLVLARAYCAAEGVGLHGLSKRAGIDKFFVRLAAGRSCKPRTAERAFSWLAANWPDDLAWSEGVVRPEIAVTEETSAMPLTYEEDLDSEQEAERLREEQADALFKARLEEANRRRNEEAAKIREAQQLLERANPWLLAEERYKAAVRGVPLYDTLKPPPGPSFGGQSPQHTAQLEAAEAAMQRQAEAAKYAAQLSRAEREAQIADLCAGQSPANQEWIRRTVKAGG